MEEISEILKWLPSTLVQNLAVDLKSRFCIMGRLQRTRKDFDIFSLFITVVNRGKQDGKS